MARRLGVFRVLVHAVLIVGAVVSLFPFGWMILTSFKSYREVATGAVFPSVWRFSNYVEAWQSAPFARYFLNSVIMAASTVLGVLLTSTLAAYAFARLEFVGKNAIFNLFLATMMIPGAITLIPNFITIQRLGWYDTYLALIVPWTASVFSIFLLRQFFAQIPQDLYDAALLDGCGHLRFLLTIVLPLSRAALLSVALFTFIGSWNAFQWPLIVTAREVMRPIQVGLAVFTRESGTDTQLLMAAAAITILPIVALYFLVQRTFIEGIASTGIRG